jgi:hypothetical protein
MDDEVQRIWRESHDATNHSLGFHVGQASMKPTPTRVTMLDSILIGIATILSALVVLLPWKVIPRFMQMANDFGETLPMGTRFFLHGGFGLLSVLLTTTGTLLGCGLLVKGRRTMGRWLLIGATGVAMLSYVFVVLGLYLPLVQTASALSAE